MMKDKREIFNLRQFAFLALILFSGLFSLYGFSAPNQKPLVAEKAFIFSANVKNSKTIIAQWKIAPNYYLYKKHFHFTFIPTAKHILHLPKGEWKKGLDRGGATEVYAGTLRIPIILQGKNSTVKMKVEYQGCSKKGFCYPPMQKTITLNLAQPTVALHSIDDSPISKSISFRSLLTNQNGVEDIMYSHYFIFLLFIFLGLGLLLAFTPCVLPMIPILTGIIVGQENGGTKKSFYLSLSYVLGTSFTYAGVGLFAAAMGSSLQTWLQTPLVIGGVSVIFVLLAFSLFGFYHLHLPASLQNRIHHWSNKHQGGNYFGVFCMGILSTLIVSPCVTAPLIGVLMYIAQTGNMLFGASALFVMGLGMGIPLLLIGTTAGAWIPKTGPWMEAVKSSCGFIMIAMAIWLLSRVLTQSFAMICWGILLIGIAVFISIYLPRLIGKHALNRGLGYIIGVFGVLFMLNGVGIPNPFFHSMPVNSTHQLPFALVRDVHDFESHLLKARTKNQRIILDFYADWCESCVSMDRNVFNKNDVRQKLKNYKLLRVDLSQNTLKETELLKHFEVIAPPTVLFFNTEGHEMNAQRIVGEVNAKEFLARIKNVG